MVEHGRSFRREFDVFKCDEGGVAKNANGAGCQLEVLKQGVVQHAGGARPELEVPKQEYQGMAAELGGIHSNQACK